jgi:hypothetical protein
MLEALSIVGTVVGILGGLAALSVFLRRRERLRVRAVPVSGSARSRLEITAVNVGVNDVTVTNLGFVVSQPLERPRLPLWARSWLMRRRLLVARKYSQLGIVDDVPETVLLRPSEQTVVSIDMDYVRGWLNPGEAAWIHLRTSLGHDLFSARPAVYYRAGP